MRDLVAGVFLHGVISLVNFNYRSTNPFHHREVNYHFSLANSLNLKCEKHAPGGASDSYELPAYPRPISIKQC